MTDRLPEQSLIPDAASADRESIVRWVDVVEVDAAERKVLRSARCVLEGGVVRCEGDPELVAHLERGISVTPESILRPADGKEFLYALPRVFCSAYLFATEVREGDAVRAFILPEMREVPPTP